MFAEKRNVARHVETVHLKIKKYACIQCGKQYGQKVQLTTAVKWAVGKLSVAKPAVRKPSVDKHK